MGRKVVRRWATGPLNEIISTLSVIAWEIESVRHDIEIETKDTTYSKFRVHNPILTPFPSRYVISSFNLGCGSCSIMAADSIERMAVWASD